MSDTQPYELTRNPVDETWGFICREHGLHRSGLTQAHALNVERKHVRDDHPDPLVLELDLKAVASMVVHAAITMGNHPEAGGPARAARAEGILEMWTAMTGMEPEDAVGLAAQISRSQEPVRAAVVPF